MLRKATVLVVLMAVLAGFAAPVDAAPIVEGVNIREGLTASRTFRNCRLECRSTLADHFDRVEVNDGASTARVTQTFVTVVEAESTVLIVLPDWFTSFGYKPEDVDRFQAFNLVDPDAVLHRLEAGDELVFPPFYTRDTAPEPTPKRVPGFEPLTPPANLLRLETPPNLGPPNSEGLFRMPDPVEGHYEIGPTTPDHERCGTLVNVAVNYTVAKEWHKTNPDIKLIVRDLNAAEGHETHMTGIDSDITTVGKVAANTSGDLNKSLELAKLFARTREVRQILFTVPGDGNGWVVDEFNAWARAEGIDVKMTAFANHHHHFHVDMLDRYKTEPSGACADGTKGHVEAGPDGKYVKFVEEFQSLAEQSAATWGFPADAALAMGALESRFGESGLTIEANNFFGHKPGSKWEGPTINMDTKEQTPAGAEYTVDGAAFRAYPTPEAGWHGYGEFLRMAGLYDRAFTHYPDDPLLFVNELWLSGYATDTEYLGKVDWLLRSGPVE